MILWKSVPLTAVLDGLSKYGIYNSQLLIVQGWCEKEIKLVCQEGGQHYTVTYDVLSEELKARVCYDVRQYSGENMSRKCGPLGLEASKFL